MTRKLRTKNKLIHGAGINDADYEVYPKINGKQVMCPYYRTWKAMVMRCYYDKSLERRPTYRGCSVCPEWIYFMKFRAWMMVQDWQGKALDKDLLIEGNKVYSPTTCVFVDQTTNNFTNDHGRAGGDCPLGVYFYKHNGKFMARCGNPFSKKQEYLGLFTCEHEAHLAWKKRKHELACVLADLQADPRVADALRRRYLPE